MSGAGKICGKMRLSEIQVLHGRQLLVKGRANLAERDSLAGPSTDFRVALEKAGVFSSTAFCLLNKF